MSTYPQLQVEHSNRSVARRITDPGPNLFLPISVARRYGGTLLLGEVGYHYSRALPDEWVVGLLAALEWSESLELLAEFRSFSQTLRRHADVVVVNLGLRRSLGPRFKLLASVGTGVTNGPDDTRFIAYLGIQILLGDERKH